MKKLVSVVCFILYLQSLSQAAPLDLRTRAAGKKVLVKALAIIVNREGNKKGPIKKINLSASELPWV
jgi:hypothetical protein